MPVCAYLFFTCEGVVPMLVSISAITESDKNILDWSLILNVFFLWFTSIILPITNDEIYLLSLLIAMFSMQDPLFCLFLWNFLMIVFTGSHGCIQSTSCWWPWFDSESPFVHDEVLPGKLKHLFWRLLDINSTMWLANKMDIPFTCDLNLNDIFKWENVYMALFAGCTWAEVEGTSGFVWCFREPCPPTYVHFIR